MIDQEQIQKIIEQIRNQKFVSLEDMERLTRFAETKAERVVGLENRNKELEYASKHNGELNEFLQKRKLPPNTLGRHVVDVVMDYVEELEKKNKWLDGGWNTEIQMREKRDGRIDELQEENARLWKAIEEIYELSKHDGESMYLDKCYVVARRELERKE